MCSLDPHDPELVLKNLGIVLPPPPAPAANYSPWILDGSLLVISGQVSSGPNGDLTGTLGLDARLEDGVRAARLCALNLLSQMRAALGGDFHRIALLLKVTGYVKAAPGFTSIPQVMDGCSSLLSEVLGPAGPHARAAIGVAELPRGCLVEVDAVLRVHG